MLPRAIIRSLLLATVLSAALSVHAHGATPYTTALDDPPHLDATTPLIADAALPASAVSLHSRLVVEIGGRCGTSADTRATTRPHASRSTGGSRARTRFAAHLEPDSRLLRAGICTSSLGTPPPHS